jgi:3-isopropylmalate dehydratase large subunit
MHALEKIIAAHSGKTSVQVGEIVNCKVDIAEVNDLYLQTIRSFYEVGGKQVNNPDGIAFVFDHYAPAPTMQSADNQQVMRQFVNEQGIRYLFDVNAGVCHQVMPEAGIVWPGMILVATDSHTTTHGAFGAFSTGVGATDMAAIMLTGELWFRVPEVIKITIDGHLRPGVMAKDVILNIIGALKQDAAVYKAIEYTGSTVDELSVAGRMVICNMAVEMGAKATYIRPDEKIMDYVKANGDHSFTVYDTDPDYQYSEEHHFSMDTLVPQVAVPHSVDSVVPVTDVAGVPVNQVFIGTCTGGRDEDIEIAARILKGKKVASSCRMVVIPASSNVLLRCMEAGYIKSLLEAGVTLGTPGCGPCAGVHDGVIAAGEVCVSTSSRNFMGRMGSTGAKIYSASPATAAASALAGKLVDPTPYITE